MHPGLDKYMMQLRMESKERENQGKPPSAATMLMIFSTRCVTFILILLGTTLSAIFLRCKSNARFF